MSLTAEEIKSAKEGYKALRAERARTNEPRITVEPEAVGHFVLRWKIEGKKSASLYLPEKAVDALITVLEHLAKGREVTVEARPKELTTQQAADFLRVSRPFLVNLLEKGEIPFHKVGTHRRIAFDDLRTYKEKIDSQRLKVLEELAKQAQELDLGY